MCTVNWLFKHIIPNDGNDGNVTCCILKYVHSAAGDITIITIIWNDVFK